MPARENFLKSEDVKVNQTSKFMQEVDNQLEKVKELYKFLNFNLLSIKSSPNLYFKFNYEK